MGRHSNWPEENMKKKKKDKEKEERCESKMAAAEKNSVESSDQKKTEADDQLSNYMNQWIVGTSSKLGKNVRWAVTATDRKKIWKKKRQNKEGEEEKCENKMAAAR